MHKTPTVKIKQRLAPRGEIVHGSPRDRNAPGD
jgi:hypothetical protein